MVHTPLALLVLLLLARASFALVDSCDCTWNCNSNDNSFQWHFPNCNGNTIPDFLFETDLTTTPPTRLIISTCPYGTNCVGFLFGTTAAGATGGCNFAGIGAAPNCVNGAALPFPAQVIIRTGFTLVSDGRGCPGCLGAVCVAPPSTNGFVPVNGFENVGAIPWNFNPLCPGQCATIDGCNVDIESVNIIPS